MTTANGPAVRMVSRPCSPLLAVISAAVAALSERIAKLETGNKSMAEECFTSGLLHDVGKIVLIAEMPREYQQVIKGIDTGTGSFRDLEMEFVGCPHDQVGAYLMSIWGLPASIVRAVQFHHSPSETFGKDFSTLTAVHCADAIASVSDKSRLNHDLKLDTGYLESLGLMEKSAVWRALYEEGGK